MPNNYKFLEETNLNKISLISFQVFMINNINNDFDIGNIMAQLMNLKNNETIRDTKINKQMIA